MPGLVRTRSSLEADDAPGPSNTNKRVRLSNGDEAALDVDDSWVLSPPGIVRPSQQAQQRLSTVLRASSAAPQRRNRPSSTIKPTFKPGQLVRVHLRNFVTYTSATFLPGPTLNMIIGPNGTGKSSVVCAICIGLDFGTTPLGRAKELSEFVKHGCSEAMVEIELKGMDGQVNPIITLDIEKEGSKKKWHINGRTSTAKDVKKITKKFGIQIDNLCHFLPQDRVVEFSRLSPKDRLSSTLRGAAPHHMTEQHEQLKELAGRQKEDLKKQADVKRHLKSLEEKQNAQRGDVERIREREEIEANVKLLGLTKPLAKAMHARYLFEERQTEVKELDREIKELSESLEPGQVAVKRKEKYAKDITVVKKAREKARDQFKNLLDSRHKDLNATDSTIKEKDVEAEKAKKDITNEEKKVALSETKIETLESKRQQQPLDFDPADFNERMREKKRQIRAFAEEIEETKAANKNYDFTIRQKEKDVTDTEEKIANLATEAGKQGQVLEGISKQTVKAWDWIQAHKSLFKGEVYSPPVISCSVKDPKRVAMIETMYGKSDLQKITCTNQDDWRMLNHEFHNNQGLNDVVLFAQTGLSMNDYKPPLPQDVAERFGVEGWAVDYITGPEPVLAWFCAQFGMHATAIIAQDMNDARFEEFQKLGLACCISPQNKYNVTRRAEYGVSSTKVASVPNQARVWSNRPVENDAAANLERDIEGWKTEIAELTDKSKDGKEHVKRLQARQHEADNEHDRLQEDKNRIQQHNNQLQAIPAKIVEEQKRRAEYKEKVVDARQRVETAIRERQQVLLKRAQAAIDHASAVDNLRTAHMHAITAAIALIEAENDVASLKQQHRESMAQHEARVAQRQQAALAKREAKQAYEKHGAEFNKVMTRHANVKAWYDNSTPEEKARSPEDLEAEIESLGARIVMLAGGDPNTVNDYEDRQRKIERGIADLTGHEQRVRDVEEEINTIRQVWEPELDALVAKISDAFTTSFNKINCLGSVEVGKSTDVIDNAAAVAQDEDDPANDEDRPAPEVKGHDFDNWTIQIRVSFREGEQLSVLDSHRQSGGERAVTTIYYLMALQTLSRAPFRVVDEINQGMDPRNERIVHERMVDIACGTQDDEEDGGSQYFLITPKLLPGLKYDPRMKVHTIASGEFMPKAEGEQGGMSMDFGKAVEKLKLLRGVA